MRDRFFKALMVMLAMAGLAGTAGAQSFRDEGLAAFRRGDYKTAIAAYEKSLATALKAFKEGDMEIVERRAELGEVYRAAGRWNDAITQLDYVWKRARYDAETTMHWTSHEGDMAMGYAEKLGKACLGAGRYEDGIMVFKVTLADAERVARTEDAMQFAGLLADTQFLANHPDDAAASVRHAAELSTREGVNKALQARALAQLASLCLRHRRADAAKPMAERAVALALEMFPADSLTVSQYEETLGSALLATGELDEAEKHLSAASAAILKHETTQSPRLVEVLLDESSLALKRDKNDDAVARALEALDIAKKRYPEGHPKIAICLTQVARCRMALNEPEKAKPLYTEALVILNKTLGEDDPETLEVRQEVIRFGPRLNPAKSSAARGPKK